MKTRGFVALLAVPLLVACGGAAKSSNTAGSTNTSGQNSGSTSGAAPGSGHTSLNKTFWFAGLKVTLADVAVVRPTKPSPGYTVGKTKLIMNANFENLGTDNSTPYGLDMALQSGGNSYLDHDSEDEKIPEVPGLQHTLGVIAFYVDDKFSLDNAILLVGSADKNQATVPLGSAGKYVSLEPQKVAVSGSINIPGAFTVAVAGADLSYDNRKSHQEEKTGETHLTVHFAVTGNRDSQCCLGTENLILKLPDGTAVAADRNSSFDIPGKGLTTPDETAEWIFKGASGAYDMIIKGKYGADSTDAQADLPFTMTLGVSASATGTPPAGGAYPAPSSGGGGVQPSPSGH